MRLVSVVGTRPQLIKLAALEPELRRAHDEVLVDTGQHWDDDMAGTFFRELNLPEPDHSLAAGGGSSLEQLAAMLVGLRPILEAERPDAVVVLGDTNSTLAGAIAGAVAGIPVAHVEAGVRSFDRRMPEERNRVATDHLASWLLAPTPDAVANLRAEGIEDGVTLVGDLMRDLAATTLDAVRDPGVLAELGVASGRYLYATLHRAANRDPGALRAWADLLAAVGSPDRPVVLPLHPGTREALAAAGVDLPATVRVVPPVGYRTSLALQLHAAAVLTDSGGVQREAAWLGVPCLVLRESSEWRELLRHGGGTELVGLDATRATEVIGRLAPPAAAPEAARRRAMDARIEAPGAARAIVDALGRPGR
jgi:UDP-N-acetylglucosamine 2-epimerase